MSAVLTEQYAVNEFTEGPLTIDEMVRILSLLENPPQAALVRKALRFYEVPEHLQFRWAGNEAAVRKLRKYANPVDDYALESMRAKARGRTSLLEVGAGFGGALREIASVMKHGAKIVAVESNRRDIPTHLNQVQSLKDTCRKLGLIGAKVELFIGDRYAESIIEAVGKHGPFDVGIMDVADFHHYGKFCKEAIFK